MGVETFSGMSKLVIFDLNSIKIDSNKKSRSDNTKSSFYHLIAHFCRMLHPQIRLMNSENSSNGLTMDLFLVAFLLLLRPKLVNFIPFIFFSNSFYFESDIIPLIKMFKFYRLKSNKMQFLCHFISGVVSKRISSN